MHGSFAFDVKAVMMMMMMYQLLRCQHVIFYSVFVRVCVAFVFVVGFGYTYNVTCVEPNEPFYVLEAFLRSQFSCIVKYFHYR